MTITWLVALLGSVASLAGTYDVPVGFPASTPAWCAYGVDRFIDPCAQHTTGDPASCVPSCESRAFDAAWGPLPGYVRPGASPALEECIEGSGGGGVFGACQYACDEAGLRAALAPQPGVDRVVTVRPSCTTISIEDSIRIEGNGVGDELWFDARGLTLEPCGQLDPTDPDNHSAALFINDSQDVRIFGLRIDTTNLDGVWDGVDSNRATGVHVAGSRNIDLNGITVTRDWESTTTPGECGPEFPQGPACLDVAPADTADTAAMAGPSGKGVETGIAVNDSIDVTVRNSLIEGMWGSALKVGGESTSIAVLSNLMRQSNCVWSVVPFLRNGKAFRIEASYVEFAGNWVEHTHGDQAELGVFATNVTDSICERARSGYFEQRTEVHHNTFIDSESGALQFQRGVRAHRIHDNLFAGNGHVAVEVMAADDMWFSDNDYDIYEFDGTLLGEETTNCSVCFGDKYHTTVITSDAFGGDAPTTTLMTCCEVNFPVQHVALYGSDASLLTLPVQNAGIHGRLFLRGQTDLDMAGEVCGDAALDYGEVCDDGTVNGELDQCKAYCNGTPVCGDGVKEGAESCDKGLGDTGDGCNDSCQWVDLIDTDPDDPACRAF